MVIYSFETSFYSFLYNQLVYSTADSHCTIHDKVNGIIYNSLSDTLCIVSLRNMYVLMHNLYEGIACGSDWAHWVHC